jgi:hypothetical protein
MIPFIWQALSGGEGRYKRIGSPLSDARKTARRNAMRGVARAADWLYPPSQEANARYGGRFTMPFRCLRCPLLVWHGGHIDGVAKFGN